MRITNGSPKLATVLSMIVVMGGMCMGVATYVLSQVNANADVDRKEHSSISDRVTCNTTKIGHNEKDIEKLEIKIDKVNEDMNKGFTEVLRRLP